MRLLHLSHLLLSTKLELLLSGLHEARAQARAHALTTQTKTLSRSQPVTAGFHGFTSTTTSHLLSTCNCCHQKTRNIWSPRNWGPTPVPTSPPIRNHGPGLWQRVAVAPVKSPTMNEGGSKIYSVQHMCANPQECQVGNSKKCA